MIQDFSEDKENKDFKDELDAESILASKTSRRELIKLVSTAGSAMAVSQFYGCATLHNVTNDYELVVADDDGKVHRLREGFSQPESADAYSVLDRKRKEITDALANHMSQQNIQEFETALYDKKDVNQAATILHSNFKYGKPEEFQKLSKRVGLEVDSYTDWSDAILFAIGIAGAIVGGLAAAGQFNGNSGSSNSSGQALPP
jgi:hypothetical protein